MDHFSRLPDGCLSEILSLTSPVDVARSSATSMGFKYASDSDIIWERFLPSDYKEIISRSSSSPVSYGTKKELYSKLSDSSLPLDQGNLSFSLDKKSGKKCFMIGARDLAISWGDHYWYWRWTTHDNSRFPEVASLRSVCWLDIRGKVGSRLLSPRTAYAAYLVFDLGEDHYGLESVNAVVRLVDHENDNDAENRAGLVHLATTGSRYHRHVQLTGKLPQRRTDGWMEVEMGSFYIGDEDVGEVEARLLEIRQLDGKSGLIVEGIEFKPEEEGATWNS